MQIHRRHYNTNRFQKINTLRVRAHRNNWWMSNKRQKSQSQLTNTKLLGLNHVFNKNNRLSYRIFWSLFVIVNICVCSFQIYDRIAFYLKSTLRTTVSVEQQQEARFPSFTICPYYGQHPKLKHIQLKLTKIANKTNFCSVNLHDVLKFSSDNVSIKEIWRNTSILENIEKYSVWDTRQSSFREANSIKVIKAKNVLGVCHTFDIPNVPNYKTIWRFTVVADYHSPCSPLILVALHPDEDYPFIYLDMNPHYFKKRSSQLYMLSIQKFIRKSTNERICNDKHVVSKCRRDCYYRILRKGLKCKLPNIPLYDLKECLNLKEAMEALEYETNRQKQFEVFANCSECHVKCDELIYTMHLLHSNTYQFKSQVGVSFTFESNVLVVVSEEYAYYLVSLFCDVGGNLGLFLGLCLVSVVEIVENIACNLLKIIQKKLN